VRQLLSRTLALFTRRRLDAQLDDEVEFHLEMLAEAHKRRGLSEADARAAARREFGGVIQMKEEYRGQRGLPLIETLVQDVRYGVRTLVRTPGFTLAALVTLALGVGANSAIFSVVNAVLLQPIPYEGGDRIVEMYRGGHSNRHSFSRFEFFREHMTSFEALAAWRPTSFNLVAGDRAEYVSGSAVSHEYFRVIGGQPLHGRTFQPQEDVPNGPDVVILRHGLWQRVFSGDPSVAGRTVQLGDRSYTVVGVMPADHDSARPGDFYVPLRPGPRGPGSGWNYHFVARLVRGVSLEQVTAEAATVFDRYKATNEVGTERAPTFLLLKDSVARDVRPALLVMLGAVAMLLLIACANTANLLLARASGRSREIAVRAALGAARGRIIRQLVTESVVLYVVGGCLGVAIAYWTVPVLVAMTPPGYLPSRPVDVDATVLLVSLGASLLTGLIFGLTPALSLSRHDLVEAFKEDGTRTTSSRRANWLRSGLVVGEVAVCMLLLVGSGLLIQTFMQLRAVDLGFDPTNVLTARMSLSGERYADSAAANEYFDRGLERLRGIPGVQSASVVSGIPVETGLNLNFDRLDTGEVEAHLTDWRYASPDYFDTIGIQIVKGRALSSRDTAGAPRVAVVSEQFARRYYKDESPIGRQILLFREDGPIEIVGVARDLREAGLKGPVPALLYVPVAQAGDSAIRAAHMYFQVSWVVRAAGMTPELTARIREELRAIDPRQPITAFRSLDEVKSRAMATERFQMTLLGIFAALGLLLSAAGIYGLIGYSVSQRTREFGIRMALGATRGHILTSVLRQGALLAAAGVFLGVFGAFAFSRTLEAFLFNVSPSDVRTFFSVAALLLLVAVLASLVPALRAVRLNPVSALRQ
jgi:putative ABC transport system permease protein